MYSHHCSKLGGQFHNENNVTTCCVSLEDSTVQGSDEEAMTQGSLRECVRNVYRYKEI